MVVVVVVHGGGKEREREEQPVVVWRTSQGHNQQNMRQEGASYYCPNTSRQCSVACKGLRNDRGQLWSRHHWGRLRCTESRGSRQQSHVQGQCAWGISRGAGHRQGRARGHMRIRTVKAAGTGILSLATLGVPVGAAADSATTAATPLPATTGFPS